MIINEEVEVSMWLQLEMTSKKGIRTEGILKDPFIYNLG
jgi:hypothetical protein